MSQAGLAYSPYTIWPFLWIWATLCMLDRGWGFAKLEEEQHDIHHRVDILIDQVSTLQEEIAQLKQADSVKDNQAKDQNNAQDQEVK